MSEIEICMVKGGRFHNLYYIYNSETDRYLLKNGIWHNYCLLETQIDGYYNTKEKAQVMLNKVCNTDISIIKIKPIATDKYYIYNSITNQYLLNNCTWSDSCVLHGVLIGYYKTKEEAERVLDKTMLINQEKESYFPIMVYFYKDKQFKLVHSIEDLVSTDKPFQVIQTNCSKEMYDFAIKMYNLVIYGNL